MFSGLSEARLNNMTPQEMRWLDNIKKALLASDQEIMGGCADECLEPLFRAIDTAKTLRRSLIDESADDRDNKKRFTHFIDLEVPTPDRGGLDVELLDSRTGLVHRYSFSNLAYAIRCMVHENENLNVAEWDGHHISLDWSRPAWTGFGSISNRKIVCNGFLLAKRLRELIAKFVTGIDGLRAFSKGRGFTITICPPFGSIKPDRKSIEQSCCQGEHSTS